VDNFLDAQVYHGEDRKLTIDVYRKPTHTEAKLRKKICWGFHRAKKCHEAGRILGPRLTKILLDFLILKTLIR
jgi:hypothetical protein